MFDTPFHYEMSPLKIGIRTNIKPVYTILICCKSPYASPRTNYWLKSKMLRVYTAYYKKVMRESRGKFWEESNETAGNDVFTTFCGGETTNGNQTEKPKKR